MRLQFVVYCKRSIKATDRSPSRTVVARVSIHIHRHNLISNEVKLIKRRFVTCQLLCLAQRRRQGTNYVSCVSCVRGQVDFAAV